jgi:hypothetical protein
MLNVAFDLMNADILLLDIDAILEDSNNNVAFFGCSEPDLSEFHQFERYFGDQLILNHKTYVVFGKQLENYGFIHAIF